MIKIKLSRITKSGNGFFFEYLDYDDFEMKFMVIFMMNIIYSKCIQMYADGDDEKREKFLLTGKANFQRKLLVIQFWF